MEISEGDFLCPVYITLCNKSPKNLVVWINNHLLSITISVGQNFGSAQLRGSNSDFIKLQLYGGKGRVHLKGISTWTGKTQTAGGWNTWDTLGICIFLWFLLHGCFIIDRIILRCLKVQKEYVLRKRERARQKEPASFFIF